MNLHEVPFSCRGSYMAVSELGEVFNWKKTEPGLYLRTVRGAAELPLVSRIQTADGQRIENGDCDTSPWQIHIAKEGKECDICFADSDTLLFRGNLPLRFEFMSSGFIFTLAQPYRAKERDFILINCFMNSCRYLTRTIRGKQHYEQDWNGSTTTFCRLIVEPDEDGTYLLSLEEAYEDWADRRIDFDFDTAAENMRKSFEAFRDSMPSVPARYAAAKETASYVDWSGMVKASGLFKREAMLMSKNWMCQVWSWDHCFNAIALSYHNPELAWDQFMLMFDAQKPSGNIPDSLSDCRPVHNYCKPPIHGWALRKLMRNMTLTKEQIREVYGKLGKWTDWWLDNRDENGDGLCEYTHGNDSGWDNSTAFIENPPATVPDLAAFLIYQMDVLSELAEKLGDPEGQAAWGAKRDAMMRAMLRDLFEDGLPVAKAGLEMKKVETNSLILYLPIVLGRLLPENIRTNMVRVLESDKFLTKYGFATESPSSPLYESDGYWRGPIWAPSTMIVLDGLWDCGEHPFVRSTAEKFCDMVSESGCSENFDALTGQGLRDRAYTWTASVMMVLAHEYLT
ncbi:MAG: amylo-alpha-1,6-glucosidase [Lachnospiraceae bacterium]|jgi:putative isomerase